MVAQGLAVAIFVAMFVLIVMDKFGRQYITLGCGAFLHRTFGIKGQGLRNPGLELTGKPLFSLPV